jgi:hypothetical protein
VVDGILGGQGPEEDYPIRQFWGPRQIHP